ncbi:DUF308 domain-containing protein [Candidatus Saccharibacteria bacterium]|nr:DUF308 domain-containing protein [Candidatus Saccharibacteria bacterium]
MAHINRKYIDKHWFVFVIRGILAGIFGFLMLFGNLTSIEGVVAMISILLLFMGIVDATSALYNSSRKHGWMNSIIDAAIDVVTAILLLFFARNDLVISLIIISIYTALSGVIDLFHGFLSTVDPTDRFIRILAGVCGCVMGAVIINAGDFEVMTFIRFFGAYMLIVSVTSLIYGVHNRAQNVEDKVARREAKTQKKTTKKRK